MEQIGFRPYVMITGLSGLHVVSKTRQFNYEFVEIREMLHIIIEKLVSKFPSEFSYSLRKLEREAPVYLSASRNAYGQTAVAPFSVRATEEASIATPIAWDELSDTSLTSRKYTIKNIFSRLANLKDDPWLSYENYPSKK